MFIKILRGATLFTDITIDTGILFSGASEGVCVFDYNNDGMDDILFTTRNGSSNHLYRNEGNMIFMDVSFESNIGVTMEARTAVAGDFDNDGDLDVFIGATVGESMLFENTGEGTFQDITDISGINISDQVRGSSWVDHDKDGFLDLYVGLLYEPNKLFKNNGDGTFVDVAQNIGAAGPLTAGIIMGLGFIDYDRDGDQDLFITQDNNNGNILLRYEDYGAYTDVSAISQIDLDVMGMGVAFGDIDRDGLFDFYTTNLYENSLLLNSISGVFLDISTSSGTEDIPGSMGWGTFFFDANNDGWVDIYNNNETAFGGVINSLMINQGDQTFNMLNYESGAVINNNGYGSAFSDFDQDGDLDMILVGHPSSSGSINLLRNDSDPQNWIMFKLSQLEQNVYGVGSTIELYHGNTRQLNFIGAGNGYCSQNTLNVHFGLGQETIIDSVIVFWPDGISESFSGLVFNEINYLNRGSGIAILSTTSESFLPEEIRLNDPCPNPFNNSTTLEIQVEKDTKSKLHIYDLKGQEVATFNVQLQKSIMNHYKINFSDFPSGIYFVNIQSSEFSV
ncbi:MAG: FG-GAP-like repeat-containing protein, partial [Candidatus Neomarinimicrobiota bacterium]|nr:FG-GAP-like repeat-containing protein [Candidatus Neomarinimicrobiota bacterium]